MWHISSIYTHVFNHPCYFPIASPSTFPPQHTNPLVRFKTFTRKCLTLSRSNPSTSNPCSKNGKMAQFSRATRRKISQSSSGWNKSKLVASKEAYQRSAGTGLHNTSWDPRRKLGTLGHYLAHVASSLTPFPHSLDEVKAVVTKVNGGQYRWTWKKFKIAMVNMGCTFSIYPSPRPFCDPSYQGTLTRLPPKLSKSRAKV